MNNAIERMNITALGGALVYEGGVWRWADGSPAPEVRPMTLRDLAPSWRVAGGMVEVPQDWRHIRRWPNGLDEDAVRAIEDLLRSRPLGMIFYEGGHTGNDKHAGYHIPAAEYDAVMGLVVGAMWDMSAQPRILAQAASLRAASLNHLKDSRTDASKTDRRKRSRPLFRTDSRGDIVKGHRVKVSSGQGKKMAYGRYTGYCNWFDSHTKFGYQVEFDDGRVQMVEEDKVLPAE